MAISWEIEASFMDYLSSYEAYHYMRALKSSISYIIKGILLIMEGNVNKFCFFFTDKDLISFLLVI